MTRRRALQRQDPADAGHERRSEEGRRPSAGEHDRVGDVGPGDEVHDGLRGVQPAQRALYDRRLGEDGLTRSDQVEALRHDGGPSPALASLGAELIASIT